MELRSLGFKSEMIFTAFDGEVEDRGDYTVVRTLGNPNFFWGNLLIFNRAPQAGDYERWTALFKKEFTNPRIYHVTCAWDVPNGEIGETEQFTSRGYELVATSALSAKCVVEPPKLNLEMEVRSVRTDEEWAEMIALQDSTGDLALSYEEWHRFHVGQSKRYQAMSKAGMGDWFGGYLDGKLVTGLGIFHRNGLGRFQIVSTHSDYRRQGLAGTLVYLTAKKAFAEMGVQELVMCADPNYFAIKIYESVGFTRSSLQHGVSWYDKNR